MSLYGRMKMLCKIVLFRVIVFMLLLAWTNFFCLSSDFYTLTDTGQPVIISLVDTATVGLQDALPSITTLLNSSDQKETINIINETTVIADGEILSVNSLINDNNTNITKENESSESSSGEPPPLIVVAEPKSDIKLENENKTLDINISGNGTETDKIEIPLNINLTRLQTEIPKSTESPEEIPSFSEWAQKQLEEAEKKDIVLNQSTQSPHVAVSVTSKIKLRSKNYASPDCGAKIVAANPEAGSPRSILSPSKDEYMLNTCNSRIWFVVELCEPIQAKKVELANFELFSSSPKDFAIYSSDRFPTRDWSSVGQFTAIDERDIQTFNLHPHIFGKFIKVEMLSHYGFEHYCPVSMFKVYGTSEFEVLETENLIHSHDVHILEDDDDEDDLKEEFDKPADSTKNLFGSARDAVMSIMKRAAEVLVKSNEPKNSTDSSSSPLVTPKQCFTPSHIIVCDNCSDSLFGDVFELLSCSSNRIKNLIDNILIHEAFQNSDVCEEYGLDFKNKRTLSYKNDTAVYISALFMPSYVAAVCNMLAIKEKKVVLNTSFEVELNATSNLTIDSAMNLAKNDENMDKIIQDPFVSDTKSTEPKKLCEKDLRDSPKQEYIDSIDLINPTKTVKTEYESLEATTAIVSGKNDVQDKASEIEKTLVIATTINSNVNQAVENLTDDNAVKNSEKETKIKIENETENVTHNKKEQVVNTTSQNETTVIGTNGGQYAAEEMNINEQISLDSFLSDLDQVASDAGSFASQTSTPSPNSATLPQAQKESVFLRLSNRIKALERNMSLSSQYLEELSRRYKKQVEEMQKTFEKTITTMTEENQRAAERDIKTNEQIARLEREVIHLKDVLVILTNDRESWFGNVTFFKFMLFQIVIFGVGAYLFLRQPAENSSKIDRRSNKNKQSQLNKATTRRKSVEGVSGHRTPSSKKRRPSEEALNIALHSFENERHDEEVDGDWIPVKYDKRKRKRKASVMSRPGGLFTRNEHLFSDEMSPREQIFKLTNQYERLPEETVVENTITLDEPEFIIAGCEPVDFENIGDATATSRPNGAVVAKDYSTANGSVIEQKPAAKQAKNRRLSSPAFLKSALSRQGSRASDSPPQKRQIESAAIVNSFNAVSESASSSPRNGKNLAALSQGDNKIKRGKSKSFKSIFKKVF